MELYNKVYEKYILGSLLLNPNVIEVVNDTICVDDFTDYFHRKVFVEIIKQISKSEVPSIISIAHTFPEKTADIANLTSIPSTGGIEFHIKAVKDLSIRRKALEEVKVLQESIHDRSTDIKNVIENIESKISNLIDTKTEDYKKTGDIIFSVVEGIEKDFKSGGITGISSGFNIFDQKTGGFHNGDFIALGARASIGKTSLAFNFAEYSASIGIPAGFLTLEMSAEMLLKRSLCDHTGISLSDLRSGNIQKSDISRFNDEAEKLSKLPLYFYDSPNAHLIDLKLKARRMVRQDGIKIIFIDYIGLIRTSEIKGKRWEQVSYISSELKSLARELDIPIIALAQVGRQAEGKAPTLADLRDSGSIEQDADVVMFLHRERGSSNTKLILSKNRNGVTGQIDLYFDAARTRFEERFQGFNNG